MLSTEVVIIARFFKIIANFVHRTARCKAIVANGG
jgi:hypothetical protein